MFSTKGQEVKKGFGPSKSKQPGIVYAHINSMYLVTSGKGDKKALFFNLETPPVGGDFEGWAIDKNNPDGEKYKGQIGKITASAWTTEFNSTNPDENDIVYKVLVIADEMGLSEEVANIEAPNIEEWIANVNKILCNKNIYFFVKGKEREYNGKTLVDLLLPRYKFASEDKNKLDVFDKSNKYHYQSLTSTSMGDGGFMSPKVDELDV